MAIYLADPEGNGIEVYWDRPSASWAWRDGMVQMETLIWNSPAPRVYLFRWFCGSVPIR